MTTLKGLYHHSLVLLTDLYQLTMANGYLKSGVADIEAVFNLFFRKNPFQGGYCVCCGLHYVIDALSDFRFDDSDLDYLSSISGNDEQPVFDGAFLDYLRELRFSCDVDAMPEGTVVFPHEPIVRVRGPIVQCQIIETLLLNIINFQTLIATKATRICQAARDEPVLEFGLRRAQGIDGGLAASRAAYIGGCAATSNVLAGKLFGIPVKGTHAHSWVMVFDDELQSFRAYADAMPNNCVFLVDTFDTLNGVRKAIEVGNQLRESGHEMVGIRLDSGDLAYLSIEARRLLDEAGFTDAAIVASNDLDEHLIANLKEQAATINVWGVGTKLATAFDQPALGGVFKLSGIRRPGGQWQYKVKLSEQAIKISNPGLLQVRRFQVDHEFTADVIYDAQIGISDGCKMIDPMDATRQKLIPEGTSHSDLLIPVFRQGELVYESPTIEATRQSVHSQLDQFHAGVKRLVNPHQFPVGLEAELHALKTRLILDARKGVTGSDLDC